VIGGYGSPWPIYLGLAQRLRRVSGLPTACVRVMPWHWWAAQRAQRATNILDKLADAVGRRRDRTGAGRVILVGHSAGGLIARLYAVDEPVWGRSYEGRSLVSGIITLGTPHCSDRGTKTGWFLSSQANRLVSGRPANSQIPVQSVAGRAIRGRLDGTRKERRAHSAYRFFLGEGDVCGDGIVPVSSALLAGAEALILEGVVHSVKTGLSWYGSTIDLIQRWWPAEWSFVS
jgi:pimeloyl-ACP methyl ester carboxylesterase